MLAPSTAPCSFLAQRLAVAMAASVRVCAAFTRQQHGEHTQQRSHKTEKKNRSRKALHAGIPCFCAYFAFISCNLRILWVSDYLLVFLSRCFGSLCVSVVLHLVNLHLFQATFASVLSCELKTDANTCLRTCLLLFIYFYYFLFILHPFKTVLHANPDILYFSLCSHITKFCVVVLILKQDISCYKICK